GRGRRRGDEDGGSDTGTERRSEHVPGSPFVHGEEVVAVSSAEAGNRGGVNHRVAAGDRTLDSVQRRDVTDEPLPGNAADVVQAAPGADEESNGVPAGHELPRGP